jgi:hypothetical protein
MLSLGQALKGSVLGYPEHSNWQRGFWQCSNSTGFTHPTKQTNKQTPTYHPHRTQNQPFGAFEAFTISRRIVEFGPSVSTGKFVEGSMFLHFTEESTCDTLSCT